MPERKKLQIVWPGGFKANQKVFWAGRHAEVLALPSGIVAESCVPVFFPGEGLQYYYEIPGEQLEHDW